MKYAILFALLFGAQVQAAQKPVPDFVYIAAVTSPAQTEFASMWSFLHRTREDAVKNLAVNGSQEELQLIKKVDSAILACSKDYKGRDESNACYKEYSKLYYQMLQKYYVKPETKIQN